MGFKTPLKGYLKVSDLRFKDVSQHTIEDAANFLLGDFIGSGLSRRVYKCKFNSSLIIKIEYSNDFDQNIFEWHIWNAVKNTPLEKWFAPVEHCSADGKLLAMRRCSAIKKENLPEEIPAIIADIRQCNWGMYKKHPVCFDYGFENVLSNAIKANRMKKVVWDTND
jgi:hypothetical protein